jgi:hypothetical protein
MTADCRVEVTTTVPIEPARRASGSVEDAASRMDLQLVTFGVIELPRVEMRMA